MKGDELLDEAVVYSVAFVAVGALSGVSHMLQVLLDHVSLISINQCFLRPVSLPLPARS